MMLKFKCWVIALLCSFISLTNNLHASPLTQSNENFFSLVEIKTADKKPMQPLKYIAASDDVSLAYRSYQPKNAQAILLFYHGAGAHSGLTYNHIAIGLQDDFDIAVYMPDIRGHGGSQGERGDTPTVEQVWSDINIMVKVARETYPNIPLFIGGHSSGAGSALNYSSWAHRAKINGYVFLAPYFGFRSKTNYDEKANVEFSTVKTSHFIINTLSGGLFLGHSKAVKFNFPEAVLKVNPEIVPFNTINMSNAVTPHSPDTQLFALQQFGLWIGHQDETFDPFKVTSYAQKNSDNKAKKEIQIVAKENHFSIIINAHNLIGSWLNKTIRQSY